MPPRNIFPGRGQSALHDSLGQLDLRAICLPFRVNGYAISVKAQLHIVQIECTVQVVASGEAQPGDFGERVVRKG
jgi:hypothetical protein